MKISIRLTKAEVKGITQYLREVGDIEKPTQKDITAYITDLVNVIHSPKEAVSDYIHGFEEAQKKWG